MQDLATSLAIDTGGFTSALLEAANVAESAGSRIVAAIRSQQVEWTEASSSAVSVLQSQNTALVTTGDSWAALTARAVPSITDMGIVVSSTFSGVEAAAAMCIPSLIDSANAMVYVGIAAQQGIGGQAGLAVGATLASVGVASVGTVGALMTQPRAWLMAGQAATTYGATVLRTATSAASTWRNTGAQLMQYGALTKQALSWTTAEWEAARTKSTLSAAKQVMSLASLSPAALKMGMSYAKAGAIAVGGLGGISNILLTIAKRNVQVEVEGTSVWASASNAILRYGSIASSVVGFVFPPWKAATVAVSTAIFATKLAMTETGQSALKWVAANSGLDKSFSRLKQSTTGLFEAMLGPMNGAKSLMEQVGDAGKYILVNLTPIPKIATTIGSAIAGLMDVWTAEFNMAASVVTTVTDEFSSLSAALENIAGGRAANLEGMRNETQELKRQAAETARVIALQQSHQNAFRAYRDMQADAAAAAGRAEEVAAVNGAKTSEEIDALRQKYQQLFAAQINGLAVGEKLSSGQMSHMKNITEAIESQAAAIKSGRAAPKEEKAAKDEKIDTSIADTYARMQEKLDQLKDSEQAARNAIMATKGATDEEVFAMLQKHDEIEKITAAQKEQKHAEELTKQGNDRIESMKDEIDKLSGAATNAEIEMRKMAKAGFSQEQIEDVGKLQEELDKLREKEPKKDKDKSGKEGKDETILRDSAAAARLVTRGIGGSNNAEKLAINQLEVQKQIVAELRKRDPKNGSTVFGKITA